jgi:hypothetical protein
VGTTGSPIVGFGFIALGTMLGVSIWAFAGLMRMIGGAPASAQPPAAPPGSPASPTVPPPPSPTRQTP